MVAFGKKLRETQIQEWQGYYINYKLMKKKVNRYSQQIQATEQDRPSVLRDFSRMLDSQIEMIVMFMLEQQGQLSSRLSNLSEQSDSLSYNSYAKEISEAQESFRAVGSDLLRLLFFVEMNAIGLRKILKKFDKRIGYKFSDYYFKTRSNHPYSQLRQICKHVGFGAVVGAISRNLAELQDLKENRREYVSIYDQPAFQNPEPIVHSINAAIERLSSSTNFLNFLGRHAMIFPDELPSPSSNEDLDNEIDDQRYHFMSLILNLVSTFLYMVNTYIIVPSADHYSLTLGAAATVCGVVIGSMAVAQVFSSVYFSAWSNRSYLRPLVFSSIILFVGNILYALAFDLNSIAILLIGRLFCGLGSARAVNRRYISDCVPLKLRMQASAGFVSAGALGMACGPAMACLFQTSFKICSLTFNEDTLPGWVMALAWLVYLLWLSISFREPSFNDRNDLASGKSPHIGHHVNVASDNFCAHSLLMSCETRQHDKDEIQNCDNADEEEEEEEGEEEEDSVGIKKPVDSLMSAYRLLTPSVKVQLLIYFMLKYAMEILLAESSVITGYYFVWSTSSVAVFLACLGFTVLPVNIVVGNYISNIFEERQVLLASEIMVCIGLILSFQILIPYSVPQYVSSALITFVSAEILEGVNLSLLSRVMSSRLSHGTYNGGLLSTEAGTLARVVADGTITLSGYFGQNMILNTTLVPALFICLSSIVATCFTYNSLY